MDIAKSETFKNFIILNKALLFLTKSLKIVHKWCSFIDPFPRQSLLSFFL